eukprot:scaffold23515_cov17-Tisochrysis_lutea.AAC.1
MGRCVEKSAALSFQHAMELIQPGVRARNAVTLMLLGRCWHGAASCPLNPGQSLLLLILVKPSWIRSTHTLSMQGNWLKGLLLLLAYVFISAGFWLHKDADLDQESRAAM